MMLLKKKMKRQLSVHMARTCNLYCAYCQAPPDGRTDDREKLGAEIRKRKIDTVSLEGGGEPTAGGNIFEWLAFLKSCGVKTFHLSTNAVALADMKLARRLAGEIDGFVVNLPACREDVYRKATRSVKFRRALAGLRNLDKLGLSGRVRFFHIIFRHNYRLLPEFADWVIKRSPRIGFVNFTFVRNIGRAAESRENLLPAYREAAPYLKIALARLKLKKIRAVAQNVPLCVLKSFEGFSFELHRWRQGLPVLSDEDPPKVKTAACRRCTLEPACCGARPDYLRVHGRGELVPSKQKPGSIVPEKF